MSPLRQYHIRIPLVALTTIAFFPTFYAHFHPSPSGGALPPTSPLRQWSSRTSYAMLRYSWPHTTFITFTMVLIFKFRAHRMWNCNRRHLTCSCHWQKVCQEPKSSQQNHQKVSEFYHPYWIPTFHLSSIGLSILWWYNPATNVLIQCMVEMALSLQL